MSKCTKVKNPCKICLGPVTQKTGLQCQGACDSWVHYGCLNYTKGRISDIKAGIIKVVCPCPDCKTSLPKEFRTDEPYSCTNIECPANKLPQCENSSCPTNKGVEKMNQTMPCPLSRCINECKLNSSTNVLKKPASQIPPSYFPSKQFNPMPMMASSSDACIDSNRCPSGCSSANVSGDMQQNNQVEGMPSMFTMEQMCNTVGLLSKQINDLMTKMQQACNRSEKSENSNGRSACSPTSSPPKASRNHQKGPSKPMSPKPCYCPNNPGYRK